MHRLSPDELRAVLKAKGWTHAALAAHWEVSAVYLSRIVNDAVRAPHWEDAFAGLPVASGIDGAAADRRRHAAECLESFNGRKRGPKPKPSRVDSRSDREAERVEALSEGDEPILSNGYRYRNYLVQGAVVTAMRDIGDAVVEGERGIVFGIEPVPLGERYGVVFESGYIEWYLPHEIDSLLAETGLVRHGVASARLTSERDARAHFDAGFFEFW
ncbi:hypothetical protein [Pandoraea sp. ISTKB]|uniref:hypothetical protein n=1 Tax=Pandoraea sp. ISTKB TaxID=1586708 RepID=UPI0008465087|nr:hypothetical protein [Pandoraea sp. ISTKB]ODP35048.1 hypothetical protein A9762_11835 [Pandoraea sp. ISTKB]